MKKSTCFLILLLAFAQVYAQAPQSFKYQSVARNASGNLLVNSSLGVRISIRDLTASGTIVFRETHSVTTNDFGLFVVSVGAGTVINGNFPGIDWGGSAKFLEVEVDFSGGTSYQSMGASQLLSVPYALYAANGPQGPAGVQGPPGPAGIQGPAGAAGLNVLSGAVNPTAGIGVNGELYINTTTNTLFGPKAAGVWPAGVSLIGPGGATGPTGLQGPAGPTGANGAPGMNGLNILSGASNPVGSTGVNGEFYINTTTNTLFGPKAAGVWPAGVSLIGPAGSTGATGPQGPVGPTGFLSPGSTAGNTPYWNGTSWVTNNSNIFNNGGNVGIGTTAPGAKLDIAGAIKISDGTQGAGKVLTSNASGLASWQSIPGGGNMMSSNNLSDVASVPAARANLGLGSMAILSSVGSLEITDGTVSSVDILDGTIANTDIASVDAGKITSGTLPVVRGGSGLASVVPGAVAYGGATNFAFTSVGTAGQLLQSNGVGAPSWVNSPAVGWGLTGNSGTVDIANFIGTTDNSPLNIRVNNQKSGRVDPAGPVFFGYQSGKVNTGINNTGIGFMALATNTTGNFNTAIGNIALSSNTTGDRNTALGHASLNSNTIGYDNTSIGRASLFANTIGNQNTAIATYALNSNISGSDNTAIGWESMRLNLTGVRNTAVGVGSLKGNADGINNTAIGRYALYTNTTGSGNTAVGVNAGSFVNNGSFNTAIGMAAGATVDNLTNTTAIGFAAEVTASNSIVLGGTGANAVNVGIGITAPGAKLDILGNIKISDGTQGAGKVLTSDANGLAVWAIGVPIGTILAWHKNLPNTPPLPAGWAECNGQVLSDPESPYNGQGLPNLNGLNHFIRGNSTSGSVGGSTTHGHTFSQTAAEDLVPDASHFSDGAILNPSNHLPPYIDMVWIIKIR